MLYNRSGLLVSTTTSRKKVVCNTLKIETLEAIIIENIKPGTIIFTYQWAGYRNLGKVGYLYGTVNHARNFLDTESSVFTELGHIRV